MTPGVAGIVRRISLTVPTWKPSPRFGEKYGQLTNSELDLAALLSQHEERCIRTISPSMTISEIRPHPAFLPESLFRQCRCLIEKYHDVYGYRCLPDLLWRAKLGSFIERSETFGQLLIKASRTRSAKVANENFATIATGILALEILSSSFVGWGRLFPEEAEKSREFLKQAGVAQQTPLMEIYVHPPTYSNSNAIALLTPVSPSDSTDFSGPVSPIQMR
jgi:hypothetical protein